MSADEYLVESAISAQAAFPPGTCGQPALVEKLFKAKFLQYASIGVVDDPWRIDAIVEAQNQAIRKCQDASCLVRELDATIAALEPIYLGAEPRWPQGRGLCTHDPRVMHASKALNAVDADTRRTILDECSTEDVISQTCRGPSGKSLFLSCKIEGNQVNSPQWLGRFNNSTFELLLAADDGPLGVLDNVCNGMPDLKTSARVNMGEHQVTYYRYDGHQYQAVYAYSLSNVGSEDGNSFSIALGERVADVTCR